MRQVVLDTETTGLDPQQGHRIIEIGCVEIENRRLTGRHYQCYLNPERDIDEAAVEVHGLTEAFLIDKPVFVQVANDFVDFVRGSELVIHNAPFDVGFLDYELGQVSTGVARISEICTVLDTLVLARNKHPGQRNSLDALCKRYEIDNSQRQLHGALLDAEILADVYLAMTSGQSSLSLREKRDEDDGENLRQRKRDPNRPPLLVIPASAEELDAHAERLAEIDSSSPEGCLWRQLEEQTEAG